MKERDLLIIGLAFALIIRFPLSLTGTLWMDMNSWTGWANRIISVGFSHFYDSWCDYLPSYLYVLYILGQIQKGLVAIGVNLPPQLIFKLPSIIADIATAWLIYKIGTKKKPNKLALAAGLVYAFNPAVLGNSTLWGQADSFFSFTLLLSFWLYESDCLIGAGAVSAFAGLLKPTGFLILPFFVLDRLRQKKTAEILPILSAFAAVFLLIFLPFNNGNLFGFIQSRFSQTLGQYPYTSLNAFNLWALLGKMWISDQSGIGKVSFQLTGWILFLLVYLIVLAKQVFGRGREMALGLAITFFAAFMFLTRMHERHLFAVFPFLTLAAVTSPNLWLPLVTASGIYVLNLSFAWGTLVGRPAGIFNSVLIQIMSAGQLASFALLPWLSRIKLKLSLLRVPDMKVMEEKPEPKQIFRYRLILAAVLVFSLTVRLFNLNYPQAYIFDEVYHAFTAQEMVKGNQAAWEWWNTPPAGFAYEWTHPPLAKLFMVAGIYLGRPLGASDFLAWRVPAAIFGTGIIFLVYLLAKKLFRSERTGVLAAFLLSCEGLTFVMSRIGMNDSYFLFFALASLIFALDKKWFWSALFWGLALSSKWTAMYLGLPLLILFAWKYARIPRQFYRWLLFLLVAVCIYFASYIPFFTSGHTFSQFRELQLQMWAYHTNLRATHSYQSSPLSWPFDIRPVWFYVNYQGNKIGNIYALGNPIIFWSGIVVLPLFIWETLRRRSLKMLFILLCYFIFWAPWIFSPRIMFLYHYLPSVPFLVMILAWGIDRVAGMFKNRSLWLATCAVLFLISFWFFYPLWSGVPVPQQFLKYLFWLPTWK